MRPGTPKGGIPPRKLLDMARTMYEYESNYHLNAKLEAAETALGDLGAFIQGRLEFPQEYADEFDPFVVARQLQDLMGEIHSERQGFVTHFPWDKP